MMIGPYVAIEKLISQASRRVEINNDQPHRAKITILDTLEARAAELISHDQHTIGELSSELRMARARFEVIRDDIRGGLVPVADSIDLAIARIDSALGKAVA